MELASWNINDTAAVCSYVQMFSCPGLLIPWDFIGAALNKPAALCQLKWHKLYVAHQPDKLLTLPKSYIAYSDWEVGVLLLGWDNLQGSLSSSDVRTSQRISHHVLAEWLPGRTAYAVKQAVKTYVIKDKKETEARLAGCPATLLGMLEAWPGPKPELLAIKHTLVPENIVAAQILGQIPAQVHHVVPCNPAWPKNGVQALSVSEDAVAADPPMRQSITQPPAPVSAPAAQHGGSSTSVEAHASHSHSTGSPLNEITSGTLLTYPATQAGSSSTSAAPLASCPGYEATRATMLNTLQCNSSTYSPVTATCSAVWDGIMSPSHVLNSSGFSSGGVFASGELCSSSELEYSGFSNSGVFASGELRNNNELDCSGFSNSGSTSPLSAVHTLSAVSLYDAGAALDACGVDLGSPIDIQPEPATAVGVDRFNDQRTQSSFAAASLRQDFPSHLPNSVAGDAIDAGTYGVDWGTAPAHFQPVVLINDVKLAAPSSRYMQPHHEAAAPAKSETAAKSTKQQVVLNTAPLRKRKALVPPEEMDPSDMGLVQAPQAAAAAAGAAAGQLRPAKRHCGRATQEQQQQQYWPMELEYAALYCENHEQDPQQQGMQWAATATVYSDVAQASMAALDSDVSLQQSLYIGSSTPTAAAAGEDSLQPPDWVAGIIVGHDTFVDSVQQVLNGCQPAVLSTETVMPQWHAVAMELDAAEAALSAFHQDVPGQTLWQLAGHQAVLAAPLPPPPPAAAASDAAIHAQGQQQQQQGATDTSAAAAASDAAIHAQGQQQQQGATDTFAADLAEELAADEIVGWLFKKI